MQAGFGGMRLGQRLVAAEQAEDGGGLVGHHVELALGLGGLAVGHVLGNATVGFPDRIGALELAEGVGVLLATKVHLRHHRHLYGNATLVGEGDAGIGQLQLGRAGEQIEQVEGKLGAGFLPVVVHQVVVGVVVEAVVEGERREELDQRLAGFFAGDAGVVVLLTDIGVGEDGAFFHGFDRNRQGFAVDRQIRFNQFQLAADRCVDQGSEFDMGGGQFLVDGFEQAQVFQHLALVTQGVERVAQAFGFGLAGIGQGFFRHLGSAAHLVAQLLGADGTPEGGAHILHQQVHRLAPLFAGDQHAVGLLAGVVVANAKVEHVPAQAERADNVLTFLRDEARARQGAVFGIAAFADLVVVAPAVAGLGQQLGQHVVMGNVELTEGEGFFHHARTAVEVEFEGAGQGFVERHRAGNRFDIAARCLLVGGALFGQRPLIKRQRLNRATGCQRAGSNDGQVDFFQSGHVHGPKSRKS